MFTIFKSKVNEKNQYQSTLSIMRSRILRNRIGQVINKIDADDSLLNINRCYLELKYINELYSNTNEYKEYEEMLVQLINMTQHKLYQLREGV